MHVGLKKHVYITLTKDDKKILDKFTPKKTSILHWISAIKLWWKRKTFNKQDWSSCVNFHGSSALSDSDIASLMYMDKLQVSIQYRHARSCVVTL